MIRVCLLLTLLPMMLRAATVTLASSGQAAHPVVVSATASERVRLAAEELADYLGRLSGSDVQLTTGDGATGVAVGTYSEFPPLAYAEQLTPQTMGDDQAYILRSHPDGLHVIGATELAVEHAVWDLLWRLGHRQYFPSPEWEIVPRHENLQIDVDSYEKPDYIVRRIWWGYGTWQELKEMDNTWKRRNRANSTFRLNTGHAYDHIISQHKAIFEANPEYYGMVGGKRKSTKICVGNPEVVQLVVDYADRYFQKNPEVESVSVDPSDGGGWCECDRCAEFATISDRALTIANAVSAMLEEKYPNKYVGMYAYAFHADPPTIQARERVIISVATAFLRGKNVHDVIAGWKAHGTELFGIREYYSVSTWSRNLPAAARGGNLGYLSKSIPAFHEEGARFMSAESGDAWGPNGLGYYLAQRMLWDVSEANRREEIVEKFLLDCFGPAVKPMRQFYTILAGETSNRLSGHLVGKMYRLLDQAGELAGTDPAIRARLDQLILYTHYVELFRAYQATSHPERQQAFETLIRFVYRQRHSKMLHTLALYRDIDARDDSVYIPKEAHFQKPEGPEPPAQAEGIEGELAELEDDLVARPESYYGNPWKSSRPFTRAEIDTILAQGIANNEVMGFEPVAFSRELVPATPLGFDRNLPHLGNTVAGRGHRTYYTWIDEAPATLELEVTGGLIAHYRDRGPAKAKLWLGYDQTVDEHPLDEAESAPDGITRTLRLTTHYTGLHRVTISDGVDKTQVVWPAGFPRTTEISNDSSPRHIGRRSCYFYVPPGTERIGGYAGSRQGSILDPEGNKAFDLATAETYFEFPIQADQTGKLWRLHEVPGLIILLTVPPFTAPHPDHLLLPREVVQQGR